MSNYRKSSKRRKIPDPNLVEIKSKFDAEFRRFSINRGKYKKFGDFRELLLSFFKLDFPFTICYTDPIHGDLLPINNDDNYGKAISSVGANVLLRIILQRQEEDLGQLRGYGNCAGAANKRKNRLSQYILGVPSYILPNNGPLPTGATLGSHQTGNGGVVPYGRLTPNGHLPHHQVDSSCPVPPPGYKTHNGHVAGLMIGRPQDFRTVSSIIDVDLVPETQRRVRLVKPPKAQKGSNGVTPALYDDRPLGFYIREGTSVRVTPRGLERVPGIFVSRLVPGGIAASTGLLAVDDEVLEVNGIVVEGRSLDQVTDMMIANASDLILTVKPANQATTLRHAHRRRDKPSVVKKNFSLDQRGVVSTTFESENMGKSKDVNLAHNSAATPYDTNVITSTANAAYVNLSDETCKTHNAPASSMVSSYSSSYASGSGSSGSTPSISHYYTPTSEEGSRAGHAAPPIPPRPSLRGRPTSGGLATLLEVPPPKTPVVAMATPPMGPMTFEGHQPTPPPRRRSAAAPPISARSRRDNASIDDRGNRIENNLGKNHLFRAQSPKSNPSRVDQLPVLLDKPHDLGRAGGHFIPRRDTPLHHFDGLNDKRREDTADLGDMFARGMRLDNCTETADASRTENELLFSGDSAYFLHSIQQNEFAMDEENEATDSNEESELDDDDVIIYDIASSPSPSPAHPHPQGASETENGPPSLILLNKTIKFSSPTPPSNRHRPPPPTLWDDEYHLVPMQSPRHVTHVTAPPTSSRDKGGSFPMPLPPPPCSVLRPPSVKKRAPKPPPPPTNMSSTTMLCSKI